MHLFTQSSYFNWLIVLKQSVILPQVILSAMASTAEKMDATSTSLTSKDSESATESLSAMEIASPLQVQNVDMCQDLDGNSGDATQLTSSGNCNPATDEIAYSKHSRCSVPHEDCQTSELITDVKLQRNAEHSRRMEIGSEENADSCAVFGESESCSVQKEENKKHPAICQSLDDEKTTEATQEMEESPSLTQPYEDTLADGKEHLLLVGDVASSETTPTGRKNISKKYIVLFQLGTFYTLFTPVTLLEVL